ncbi:MAG: ribonuclease HI family protein [Candidatus Omnitrophota bacterium]
MSQEFQIFVDGGSSGNPGIAAIGVCIRQNKKIVRTISQYIGQVTNNIAEYTACIYGLQEALMLGAQNIKVFTDSELLYQQIVGRYKINNPNLKFLHAMIMHLCKGFERIEFKQIPREKNQEADKLASEAIKNEQAKMVAPMLQLFDSNKE